MVGVRPFSEVAGWLEVRCKGGERMAVSENIAVREAAEEWLLGHMKAMAA